MQAAPKAAPQQEPASTIHIGWGRDYLDNGKPIDASAAPVPNLAAILQQEAQEPIGWTTGIAWRSNTRLQSEQVVKITRDAQPMYGYTTPLYTAPQPAPAPLSDDVVKDAARYRWLREGNDAKHGAAWHVAVNLYGCEWDAAIDAALASQGGK
jgi:hypothetical protein